MANHLLSPSQNRGHVTWSPCTQVCVVNMYVLYRDCVQRLHAGDRTCGTVTVLCSLVIKTFPFSCTFASCEQGPEVPFCGEVGLW